MRGCLNNSNINNFLAKTIIHSPAVEPAVMRGVMAGRMTTICDLYATGAINLREDKIVSKNALKFYDKNLSLKRDLESYSK